MGTTRAPLRAVAAVGLAYRAAGSTPGAAAVETVGDCATRSVRAAVSPGRVPACPPPASEKIASDRAIPPLGSGAAGSERSARPVVAGTAGDGASRRRLAAVAAESRAPVAAAVSAAGAGIAGGAPNRRGCAPAAAGRTRVDTGGSGEGWTRLWASGRCCLSLSHRSSLGVHAAARGEVFATP